MKSREQLLREIADLDRQMNDVIAKNPATQLNLRVRFPWIAWILTAALAGSYQYGQGTVPIPREYWDYQFYAAIIIGLFAVYRTFKWIALKGKSGDSAYREANEALKNLRRRKAELQTQLDQAE